MNNFFQYYIILLNKIDIFTYINFIIIFNYFKNNACTK